MSADLIPEILEADATGETARIYGEIRRLWAVPNVTTIVRHVATVPGCLEWAWATLEPAMRCGDFQRRAEGLAPRLDLAPLPRLPLPALRAMGVDATAEAQIRDVFAAYNRNNRPNLLFVCALKRLLAVGPGGGEAYRPRQADWTPPAPAGPLVPMVQAAAMAPEVRALALAIGSWGFPAGTGFLPGVYRHLATWPAYLAHVGAMLWPRLESGEIRRACDAMIGDAEAMAAELVATLPPPDGIRPPAAAATAGLDPVFAGITPKIPEMIVICRLLEDALPDGEMGA